MRISTRTVAGALMLLGLAWITGGNPLPDNVHWYDTLDEATIAARQSSLPMLLDFRADWCAPCKVMDREVYSSPEFADAARGFIAVRIDFDKKTAIARKYNVTELPTLLYTDSFGSELFRHTGFLDRRPVLDLLHSLPSDVSEFNRLDEVLLQNKNDFEALKEMGARLRAGGLFLSSNDYYDRVVDTREAKAAPAERATIWAAMGANSLDLKDGKQAADAFEKCLKESPTSDESARWMLQLGDAYVLANKRDKAIRILKILVQQYPSTPESQKAQALLASL